MFEPEDSPYYLFNGDIRVAQVATYAEVPADPPSPAFSKESVFLLRRLFRFAIVVFFLLTISAAVCWGVLNPQSPMFIISSMSFTSFNLTAGPPNQFTADFNFSAFIQNPNEKIDLYFDNIEVSLAVAYAELQRKGGSIDETILSTSFPSIYLGTKNSSILQSSLSAKGVTVKEETVNAIAGHRYSSLSNLINLRFATYVRFDIKGLRTKRYVVNVSCKEIALHFENASSKAGSLQRPQECWFEL